MVKKTPQGLYLDSDKGELLLPNKYIPESVKIGDKLNVFIYSDSEDRLIATTLKPYAQEGEFACLTVKQISKIGAFLDWGLEKDLFVPIKEQHKPMDVGERHVVRVCLDLRTDRLLGVSKIGSFLEKDTSEFQIGQEVKLMVYEFTTLGIMCIVNNRFAGMLYKNEVFKELEIGEQIKGYIKNIREEDDKIDLSLRKEGFDGIKNQADVILLNLKQNNGFLPYGDDSSPEDIKQQFQMSKKTFKRLIGNLYKQGKIVILEHGIKLKH
ncbi:MAG: S1-like domain-containing RNA-binding protein [Thermoflexibacter sp.]|nr:S1-like domain-containing RNA-binding protein [Thermoflexibacter sp.]